MLSLCHLIPVEAFIGIMAQRYPNYSVIIQYMNYIYWILVSLVGIYHWKDKILERVVSHAFARLDAKLATVEFQKNLGGIVSAAFADESFKGNMATVASQAFVNTISSEITMKNAVTGEVKTVTVPAFLADAVIEHIRIHYLSDKGVLAREIKGAIGGGVAQVMDMPPELMTAAMKEAQKHPLMAMAIYFGSKFLNGGALPGGAPSHGNGGNTPYRGL